MPKQDVSEVLARLAAARGTGEAAGGLVRVEVDGTSSITDLVIEPRAMRLSSEDLARAVREAFDAAREQAQQSLQSLQESPGATSARPGEVDETLARLGADAQRRLDEFAGLARELSERLGRA